MGRKPHSVIHISILYQRLQRMASFWFCPYHFDNTQVQPWQKVADVFIIYYYGPIKRVIFRGKGILFMEFHMYWATTMIYHILTYLITMFVGYIYSYISTLDHWNPHFWRKIYVDSAICLLVSPQVLQLAPMFHAGNPARGRFAQARSQRRRRIEDPMPLESSWRKA